MGRSGHSGIEWSGRDELLICGSSVRSRQGPLILLKTELGQQMLKRDIIKVMLITQAKINSIYLIFFGSMTFLFLFFQPIYGTTDDYILDSWLNGSYSGQNENESIFITPIFSNLMSTC